MGTRSIDEKEHEYGVTGATVVIAIIIVIGLIGYRVFIYDEPEKIADERQQWCEEQGKTFEDVNGYDFKCTEYITYQTWIVINQTKDIIEKTAPEPQPIIIQTKTEPQNETRPMLVIQS